MKNCCSKLYVLLFLLTGVGSPIFAQYSIRLRIVSHPVTHQGDSTFAAGNFNNWQPDKKGYIFSKTAEPPELQIKNLPPGIYEFKTTRESWQKTEATINGANVENHLIKLISNGFLLFINGLWPMVLIM